MKYVVYLKMKRVKMNEKMIRKKIDENKKMPKEYNARGERMYKNPINRENAKTEKINKNKMKKITYSEFQNTKKYKISEEYSVVFFTIGRCAFFRYFMEDGVEVSLIDRSCILHRLSGEETERLFNFEDEKKEEFKKYIF